MAKLDLVTKKNLLSFINSKSPAAVLGDSQNPLKSFLKSLGIVEDFKTLLLSDRFPVWAVNFQSYVENKQLKTVKMSTAAKYFVG